MSTEASSTPGPQAECGQGCTVHPSMAMADDENGERTCWICFDGDSSGPQEWMSPCKCQGTVKWVHRQCLTLLIDDKQDGDLDKIVLCPQCKHQYNISYPPAGGLEKVSRCLDRITNQLCPIDWDMSGLGSIIFHNLLSYGVTALIELSGLKQLSSLLKGINPIILHVVIICALMFIQREHVDVLMPRPQRPAAEEENYGRGAVVFPAIAWAIGKYVLSPLRNSRTSTFFGGLLYISVKGVIHVYLRIRRSKRIVYRVLLNYVDELNAARVAACRSTPLVSNCPSAVEYESAQASTSTRSRNQEGQNEQNA